MTYVSGEIEEGRWQNSAFMGSTTDPEGDDT
jgi:hypothetical protein